MISIVFNENGYVISGEGVEVSRRCLPARTIDGDEIFQNIHHSYKVLYLALEELRYISSNEDVMVYGDSRIIDEINRLVPPIDSECQKWYEIINWHTIPTIKPVVFFRKQATNWVSKYINDAHSKTFEEIDSKTKSKILKHNKPSFKNRALEKLKKNWFKNE